MRGCVVVCVVSPVQTLYEPSAWTLSHRAQWLQSTRLAVAVSQLFVALFQLEVVIENDDRVQVTAANAGQVGYEHTPVPRTHARTYACTSLAHTRRPTVTHTLSRNHCRVYTSACFGHDALTLKWLFVACARVFGRLCRSGATVRGWHRGGTLTCRHVQRPPMC